MMPRIQFQNTIPAIVNQPITFKFITTYLAKENFQPYTNSAPLAGDFWFDSTFNGFAFNEGTGANYLEMRLSGIIAFNKAAYSVTLPATTKTQVLPIGANTGGTLHLPAGFLTVGKILRFRMVMEVINGTGFLPQTFDMAMQFASSNNIIAECKGALVSPGIGQLWIVWSGEIVCRATGGVGIAVLSSTSTMICPLPDTGAPVAQSSYCDIGNFMNFDTSVAQDIVINYLASSPGNFSLEVDSFTMEVLG